LRDAVAAARQIAAHLFARARKVPRCLDADAGDSHQLELSREQKPRQQLSVLAVTLDPITRRARRLARSDDVDGDAGGLGRPIEREPGRPRLITGTQRLRQRWEPRDHLLTAAAKTSTTKLAAAHVDRSSVS